MGAGARIAIAMVLIFAIIMTPIVRITTENKTVELTYGPIALASTAVITYGMFEEMHVGLEDLAGVLKGIVEEGNIPMNVNFFAFLVAIFVSLIYAIPLGAIMGVFSRAGFGLTLAGSIMLLVLLMGTNQEELGGVMYPDYGLFIIMILAILGIVFGGSKKVVIKTESKS
ncbi:Hypothetical protein PAB0834 [Pyrococcus abyssi GE5]|uniref:Uncharacterized protein n=2 Tax=Pyrococcus abyssi TaxID=29292 RepID=Q9UZ90_PYRAB|nr:Hypothetical protein PAB0834 [Pyrococcus abyssi GE5]CCE70701.1 TPA: hypothetical protein PAB0834 [Pyrococcus abyssi GE5]